MLLQFFKEFFECFNHRDSRVCSLSILYHSVPTKGICWLLGFSDTAEESKIIIHIPQFHRQGMLYCITLAVYESTKTRRKAPRRKFSGKKLVARTENKISVNFVTVLCYEVLNYEILHCKL